MQPAYMNNLHMHIMPITKHRLITGKEYSVK